MTTIYTHTHAISNTINRDTPNMPDEFGRSGSVWTKADLNPGCRRLKRNLSASELILDRAYARLS